MAFRPGNQRTKKADRKRKRDEKKQEREKEAEERAERKRVREEKKTQRELEAKRKKEERQRKQEEKKREQERKRKEKEERQKQKWAGKKQRSTRQRRPLSSGPSGAGPSEVAVSSGESEEESEGLVLQKKTVSIDSTAVQDSSEESVSESDGDDTAAPESKECECSFCYGTYCGDGQVWVKCGCDNWVHEQCIEDVFLDEKGKERFCPFCLN